MEMKKRKFIYLCNKNYDGTVYRTQVIDWLELYKRNEVVFDLYQLFHIKESFNLRFIQCQIKNIKINTSLYKGFLILFPSKGLYIFLNVVSLYFRLLKYVTHSEILIFSRGLLGKEINILKRLFPKKIIFYFDSRAASAEENKYISSKQNNFSFKKFRAIAHVSYIEYRTLLVADKIFAVSTGLIEYFIRNYNITSEKFVLYPCLSDSNKFYYDVTIRKTYRERLGLSNQTLLFLYAGGISCKWHLFDEMFQFFNQISINLDNVCFLFLTKDHIPINEKLDNYPSLKDKMVSMSDENDQMNKYLNAADYGILFRENTVMNNVASPTKFSEYLLCGLPVIISEGVGDYSAFTQEKKVGIIINEKVLQNISLFDLYRFQSEKFDRQYIANIGKTFMTKEKILPDIITLFRS